MKVIITMLLITDANVSSQYLNTWMFACLTILNLFVPSQKEQQKFGLQHSIGIITFYSRQRALIQQKLLVIPNTAAITVKTVDAYQVRRLFMTS